MKSSITKFSMIIYVFLFLYLHRSLCYDAYRNDHGFCQISMSRNEANEKQPLILRASSTPKILYPEITSPMSIKLQEDQVQARVACPSNFLAAKSINQNVSSAFLICLNSRATLSLPHSQNDISSFKEISCMKEPAPVARIKEIRPCSISSCTEIGFQLNVFDFIPVIKCILMDTDSLQTLMAYVKIVPVIESRQVGKRAWPLRRGPIFENVHMNIKELYKRDYQRGRFMKIFENKLLVDKYIDETGEMYLTGSQLISEQDLFYRTEQGATFFHENIVPMWQSIATGNWELAGEFVRKLAADTATGLQVWSGTIDVLALPDLEGCARKIYLSEDIHGRQMIPVAKLLFKYVYDAHRHRGLVIVTVNDPHLFHGMTSDLILCRGQLRICQELNPLFLNVQRGYTYCCSLQDFEYLTATLNLPTFPRATSLA